MKSIYRYAFLFVVPLCMGISTRAQDVSASNNDTAKKISPAPRPQKIAPKGPKPITNEVSFGYRLHTSGWSAYVDLGKIKARNTRQADMFHNVNFWQLELSERKHPKQEKAMADGNASGRSGNYVYGKINNFYGLKLGYGHRKMLAGKPDPGSVSIHWSNVLGASLGMLKPYYLNVYSDPNAIRFSEATQSDFLDQFYILGSAGFGKGIDEIKMIPGGHFKSMLHFDFSANRKSVVAIETGINIDYYSDVLPIMANQKAEPYFVDIFLAFQFGKRW